MVKNGKTLSATAVKAAKPTDKPYKIHDANGLYLTVNPTGSKIWRVKYKIDKKEYVVNVGDYLDISLEAARVERDKIRAELRAGRNPAIEKKAVSIKNDDYNFETVARRWTEKKRSIWSKQYFDDVTNSLSTHIFPTIGNCDLREIDRATIYTICNKIAESATETAHRVANRISDVYEMALSAGLATLNPAMGVSKSLPEVQHEQYPAITDLAELQQMMRVIAASRAQPITKLALYLQSLVVVRPGELRKAAWEEFDIESNQPVWNVPAKKMKGKTGKRRPHFVPLSRQAIEVLGVAKQFTGQFEYVFINKDDYEKPMSGNAMGFLLKRNGYKDIHVPHGFRSSFSSIMNSRYPADRPVIDAMMAHKLKGISAAEAAYNRADYAQRRHELAQIWADLLFVDIPAPADMILGPRHN